MKVTMRTTAAGPDGVFMADREYDMPAEIAAPFIEAGAAYASGPADAGGVEPDEATAESESESEPESAEPEPVARSRRSIPRREVEPELETVPNGLPDEDEDGEDTAPAE